MRQELGHDMSETWEVQRGQRPSTDAPASKSEQFETKSTVLQSTDMLPPPPSATASTAEQVRFAIPASNKNTSLLSSPELFSSKSPLDCAKSHLPRTLIFSAPESDGKTGDKTTLPATTLVFSAAEQGGQSQPRPTGARETTTESIVSAPCGSSVASSALASRFAPEPAQLASTLSAPCGSSVPAQSPFAPAAAPWKVETSPAKIEGEGSSVLKDLDFLKPSGIRIDGEKSRSGQPDTGLTTNPWKPPAEKPLFPPPANELPKLAIDVLPPGSGLRSEIAGEVRPPRVADSIHTRADVIKELRPVDRDRFEVLSVERSAASHPEEIAKKDKLIKDFLTERLGAAVSQTGWKSVLQEVPLADALKGLDGKTGSDGKPYIEHIQQLLLDRAATAIPDRAKFMEFIAHLAAFRWRAKDFGLSDSNITETLLNVSRVLDPLTRTRYGDPQLIARGMMKNASDPTGIDQGGHNTCNVTTLECRLYTREPQAATKLVADVVINGQFKTADGSIIKPRTLTADGEALADPTPDGSRNYASQVFQITAINVHWNRKDTLPGGKEAGVGNIFYCQGGPGEPSEYLLNCSKMPPEIHHFSTIDSNHPWLDLSAISEVNEQITGRPSVNFGIERWYVSGDSHGCFRVSSLKEFKDRLAKMAEDKAFPVVLVVDAAKKPIGSGEGGFGPHVVTITHYDPNTGMLTIDNQWGKGADMTDIPGQRGRVSAADMFDNMSQFPSTDYLWDHVKRNIKDIGVTDAFKPGIAALSVKGLRYGMFGGAPSLLHAGFETATRNGLPGAASALAASETRLGRIGMRAGTALGAVGFAFLANDLRSAFKEGTAHGIGKLSRVGVDSMSYELGALTGSGLARLTTLRRWAPGRVGLMIAGGLAVSAIVDKVAGESVEIGASYLYEKGKERAREWWKR